MLPKRANQPSADMPSSPRDQEIKPTEKKLSPDTPNPEDSNVSSEHKDGKSARVKQGLQSGLRHVTSFLKSQEVTHREFIPLYELLRTTPYGKHVIYLKNNEAECERLSQSADLPTAVGRALPRTFNGFQKTTLIGKDEFDDFLKKIQIIVADCKANFPQADNGDYNPENIPPVFQANSESTYTKMLDSIYIRIFEIGRQILLTPDMKVSLTVLEKLTSKQFVDRIRQHNANPALVPIVLDPIIVLGAFAENVAGSLFEEARKDLSSTKISYHVFAEFAKRYDYKRYQDLFARIQHEEAKSVELQLMKVEGLLVEIPKIMADTHNEQQKSSLRELNDSLVDRIVALGGADKMTIRDWLAILHDARKLVHPNGPDILIEMLDEHIKNLSHLNVLPNSRMMQEVKSNRSPDTPSSHFFTTRTAVQSSEIVEDKIINLIDGHMANLLTLLTQTLGNEKEHRNMDKRNPELVAWIGKFRTFADTILAGNKYTEKNIVDFMDTFEKLLAELKTLIENKKEQFTIKSQALPLMETMLVNLETVKETILLEMRTTSYKMK